MSAFKMLTVGEKRYLLSWMLLLSFVRLLDQLFLFEFCYLLLFYMIFETSLGTETIFTMCIVLYFNIDNFIYLILNPYSLHIYLYCAMPN